MEMTTSTASQPRKPGWITACLALLIGATSGWMSAVTGNRVLFEYIISPLVKDAYIYPEWRYRIFDVVLVAWCLDGLIAAVLLFRCLILRENVTSAAHRTTVLWFLGFGVLVIGGLFGVWLRSHGI